MASFEIHFDSKGQVLVNNIQGVSGDACLGLTKPYVDRFGGTSETIMLPNTQEGTTNRPLENS